MWIWEKSVVKLLGGFPFIGRLTCAYVCGIPGDLAPLHRWASSVRFALCAVSWAPSLLFAGVPSQCVVLRVRCPGPVGSCSQVCSLGALCCVLGTCVMCTSLPARCVVLGVRCPLALGSYSPVRTFGVFCCVCGVLGHLAPVQRCARSAHCLVKAVSWATWLLFAGVLARCPVFCVRYMATWLLSTLVPSPCGVLRVRYPWPLGSRSRLRTLGALCCVCGVLGLLAPVQRCALPVRCLVCALSLATGLLFTGVPARCVVLRVRCCQPLGSCSPVSSLGVLCCVCSVLCHLAVVHRCVCLARCVVSAVSWDTLPLFNRVPAWCVALCVRCHRPLGSCLPVCPLDALCYVCGVLGHMATSHQCARSVCCVACAVSWATLVLFTAVLAQCVALRVRCPGPLGFCSPVCTLGVLCCV